ncbi:hypothetical protein ACWGKW_20485 [Streptomyces sp. NPDC054766]
MTAAVLIAAGDIPRFRSAIRLARADWRDLLMAGELGYEDRPHVLDELGRAVRPCAGQASVVEPSSTGDGRRRVCRWDQCAHGAH